MGKIVAAMGTVHAPQLFVRPPSEDLAQLDADAAAMRLIAERGFAGRLRAYDHPVPGGGVCPGHANVYDRRACRAREVGRGRSLTTVRTSRIADIARRSPANVAADS